MGWFGGSLKEENKFIAMLIGRRRNQSKLSTIWGARWNR